MSRLKIGITHGDINGISYEVIIKTLSDTRLISNIIPIIYGSPKVLAYYRKALNNNSQTITINSVEDAKARNINVINCNSDDVRVEMGLSTEMAGLASYQALEKAVQDLKSNKIDIIVTAPINKKNIQAAGFNFPGHTEFFAKEFNSKNHLMILMNDAIKIGVVTGHIPLSEVPSAISQELILEKLNTLNQSLKNDFLIKKPRIAVLSLNPHCGDDGLIGKEEKTIIIPAIEQAKNQDILAFGPYPADGFFGAALYKKFDAVLAMYHDQGLAPFKVIAFEDGVNYTAGLPIVRTSPAHGTAYEITGKNIASEQSFRSALYKAVDIYKNRNFQAELEKGKLNIEDLGDIKEINQNGE
ncbi:MAG: 4-hydroxythreonine-4-phosphate dehydrogenase PdxA [Bacteroidales bacterium]|jgi:4-hydroxythreonine-4-phosphate dehydrogenase|nr:4-hydroxythreonine-4-phosphate dehydrogenase PdxA [Bacteroidales bacterium]MCK9499237.1 4-hydroxythreonine-4-phosphate dehydrogenase PdxA [Bacteroidales bacterium]MDY0313730.1 4-hydroxythreonine-4-phosphate dehydrogenase PdxA [Bacteroidales bacterium]NLB86874.1 4-hydroxythreonine-4-phosphate dehydrogenase PdxA [Bacteroidales bacterium]